MEEEIKEILEGIEIVIKHDGTLEFDAKELKILLDYITNLQEEAERQSKAQVILDNQIAEMWKYKQRNEKAIDFMNNTFSISNVKDMFNIMNELENILEGDKDE